MYITPISQSPPRRQPLNLRRFSQLQQALKIYTLRPLNRQPERSIPNQLRQRPQPPTHPKRSCIIKRLMEAIMMEQHPTTTIDIRERVLRLPMLGQHTGRDLAVALDELEDGIFCDLGAGRGKGHEGFETGVWFAEDGVPVAGDYLAGFEGGPEVGFYVGVGEGGADVRLHFQNPAENFLGGEAGEGDG